MFLVPDHSEFSFDVVLYPSPCPDVLILVCVSCTQLLFKIPFYLSLYPAPFLDFCFLILPYISCTPSLWNFSFNNSLFIWLPFPTFEFLLFFQIPCHLSKFLSMFPSIPIPVPILQFSPVFLVACHFQNFLSLSPSIRLPVPVFEVLPLCPVPSCFKNFLAMSPFVSFPVLLFQFFPVYARLRQFKILFLWLLLSSSLSLFSDPLPSALYPVTSSIFFLCLLLSSSLSVFLLSCVVYPVAF